MNFWAIQKSENKINRKKPRNNTEKNFFSISRELRKTFEKTLENWFSWGCLLEKIQNYYSIFFLLKEFWNYFYCLWKLIHLRFYAGFEDKVREAHFFFQRLQRYFHPKIMVQFVESNLGWGLFCIIFIEADIELTTFKVLAHTSWINLVQNVIVWQKPIQ